MQVTLKAARDDKEWTLETLAEKSGIDKSTISRLERGLTRPTHDTVKALEKALRLPRGTLLFEQRESAA
jgi:transcriptional regulator with XRE-family HTH domain